jgi:hypothetical protein
MFCGHLLYFVAICYIFPPFWYVVPRKIWQPCSGRTFFIADARRPGVEIVVERAHSVEVVAFAVEEWGVAAVDDLLVRIGLDPLDVDLDRGLGSNLRISFGRHVHTRKTYF